MVQQTSNPEVVELLLDGARYGDVDEVKQALAQGASIDSADEQGRTGFHDQRA